MGQPGEETAQGDLVHVDECPMEVGEEDRDRLFPVVPGARGKGQELKSKKVSLNIRKILFYCEGGSTWEEVVQRGCVDSTLGD